jgi:hypothetical protein
MLAIVTEILTGQYEASLAMPNQCIEACPLEHSKRQFNQLAASPARAMIRSITSVFASA